MRHIKIVKVCENALNPGPCVVCVLMIIKLIKARASDTVTPPD